MQFGQTVNASVIWTWVVGESGSTQSNAPLSRVFSHLEPRDRLLGHGEIESELRAQAAPNDARVDAHVTTDARINTHVVMLL